MAGFGALTVLAIGGTTYAAAINWFGTDVQTSNKDSAVTVSAKDCPASLLQSYKDSGTKTTYDIDATYKILKPDVISAADLKKAAFVACEHRAIDGVAKQSFPASYQYDDYGHSNQKDGFYIPASNYGTVSGIEGDKITINDVHVSHQQAAAERKIVTLSLAKDTQVLDQGKKISLDNLKPGDQIYFTFQNKVRPGGNMDKLSVLSNDVTALRVIAKTQYDYRAQDKLEAATSQGAVETTTTNDAISG